MATRKSSTLRTAGVHTFKYNVTNAHRVLRMMNDPETTRETRAALRAALKRLAACTDIGIDPRCTGMWSPIAITSPSPSKTAQE